MKTEIRIEAEITDEQLDCLLTEIKNTAEIIGIKLKVEPSKMSQHDVSKRYDINFDGNVMAGIEVVGNEISIYGAMNGWGNAIDIDKCLIEERTE